ncbi:efflux RND transporter periplasmic adaptor subunit [Aeoliella mucimassa]|uniref:Multidrug resistance protein MdtA n=1 Tax=Aeoliella mucimassa TaxID=2527972 RepID=A0A518AQE8_9BACT|nr:efflux RND transporter periplasmic adaptor subunit [Aeoliella mucimassa]QDU56949.1 Multidrug resistance protein MdtA precursor [Aeoliella mucimassa]
MSATSSTPIRLAGLLLRVAIPCVILAAGWFGFQILASHVEEEPAPEPKKLLLRSRVEEMEVVDFPVTIETNAVVQAHNQVTLNAQVSGVVTSVSANFEVGAYFNKGDLLVEIDQRDYHTALSIANSELEAAKSELKLAKVVEDRKLKLVGSNAVSQGEVDAATATREQAEANVALAETGVEQAELNLTRTRILAPFDGRVLSKLIGIGQLAGANTPLGEIFAIDYVEVRLPISGDQRPFLDLPEFPEDEPLPVTLRDGIQDTNTAVWRGNIVRTEGVLDENSRDLYAIARVEDPFGRTQSKPPLRIGQPVVASIQGTILHDVVALPRAAVRQLDSVVLVTREEHTLLPLKVKPIWSDTKHVIVAASTIPTNMLLATTPMPYSPKGSKIEIIPAADPTSTIADTSSPDSEQTTTN